MVDVLSPEPLRHTALPRSSCSTRPAGLSSPADLPASAFVLPDEAPFGSMGHCTALCRDVLECAIAGLWYRCAAGRESSEGLGTASGNAHRLTDSTGFQDPDRFL